MSGTKQAARRSTSPDDGCVLPYIAAFHRLRAKSEGGAGLTLEEGQMLAGLLSAFESRRVVEGRLVRKPLRLEFDRAARLVAAGCEWRGIAREASLRHFVVYFDRPVPIGVSGQLSVLESSGEESWWRFAGRITRTDARSGRTVIELGQPLGRDGIEWHAA
jgi:hypothetical protein